MNKNVECLIQQLELLMRGGNLSNAMSDEDLLNLAKEVFDWYSSLEAKESAEVISSEARKQETSLGIKLHNKARNLTLKIHSQLRTILKAIAGWIILIYSDVSPKVLGVVIKLLSRACQEIQYYPGNENFSLSCSSAVIYCWSAANSFSIQRILPPLELQDIKISVFHAYMERARILNFNSEDHESIRREISGGMEIVQTLGVGLQIIFSEAVLRIGLKCAEKNELLQHAIHYFKIALNILEMNLRSVGDENFKEIHELTVKVELALAYAYMEINEAEKALACIHKIEEFSSNSSKIQQKNNVLFTFKLQESLQITIEFAKFTIAIKDGDSMSAINSIRKLFHYSQATYEMLAKSVKQLLYLQSSTTMKNQNGQTVDLLRIEFYKALTMKFPNDPDFTNTRISHLQSILNSTGVLDKESIVANDKAFEISNSIVTEHNQKLRILTQKNYSRLRTILIERIQMHRSSNSWKAVSLWCECLLNLVTQSDDELQCIITVLLIKSDAFINMKQFREALEYSNIALSKCKNTRTMVMKFRAELHSKIESDNEALNKTVKMFCKLQEISKNSLNGTNVNFEIMENLSRLIICCKIAQTSTFLSPIKRDLTNIYLLHEWLNFFVENKVWNIDRNFIFSRNDSNDKNNYNEEQKEEQFLNKVSTNTDDIDDDDDAISGDIEEVDTYFGIANEALFLFLNCYLECKTVPNNIYRTDVNKNKIINSYNNDNIENKIENLNRKVPITTININGTNEPISEIVKTKYKSNNKTNNAINSSNLNNNNSTIANNNINDDNTKKNEIKAVNTIYNNNPDVSHNESFIVLVKAEEEELLVNKNFHFNLDTSAIFTTTIINEKSRNVINQNLDFISTKNNALVIFEGKQDSEYNTKIDEQNNKVNSIDVLLDTKMSLNNLLVHSTQSTVKQEILKSQKNLENNENMDISNDDHVSDDDDEYKLFNKTQLENNNELHDQDTEFNPIYEENVSFNTNNNFFQLFSTDLTKVRNEGEIVYSFKCSIAELEKNVLSILENIEESMKTLKKEEIKQLGSSSDLQWQADLAWNLGTILLKSSSLFLDDSHNKERSIFSTLKNKNDVFSNHVVDDFKVEFKLSSPNDEAKSKSPSILNNRTNNFKAASININSSSNKQKVLLSSRFYEVAEVMYSKLPYENNNNDNNLKNRYYCRIIAAAARLDAESFDSPQNDDLDNACNKQKISDNLSLAIINAQTASSIVKKQSEFESEEIAKLRKAALVLEFAASCKIYNQLEIEQFIKLKQNEFLTLSCMDLNRCADIARMEKGGTVDITITLLNFALQACNRDVYPDYKLMGDIYVKLIELSPTRLNALERVEEFDQISDSLAIKHNNEYPGCSNNLMNNKKENYNKKYKNSFDDDDDVNIYDENDELISLPFEIESVDRIVSLAYNYGVTLVDLDQVELAEKFVSKAINLSKYSSKVLKKWLPRMQDTYTHVLKAKSDCLQSRKASKLLDMDFLNTEKLSGNENDKVDKNTGKKRGSSDANLLDISSAYYMKQVHNVMVKDAPLEFSNLKD